MEDSNHPQRGFGELCDGFFNHHEHSLCVGHVDPKAAILHINIYGQHVANAREARMGKAGFGDEGLRTCLHVSGLV